MNELDQMQAILENKIIEISDLKQILQAEIHALEGKPKHLTTIKNNVLSLKDIIKDLKSVFEFVKQSMQSKTFQQTITSFCLEYHNTLIQQNMIMKKEIQKLNHQLQQQMKLNDLTKQQVLDLKQMINLHIQKSQNQLSQKDKIIDRLQQIIKQGTFKSKQDENQVSKTQYLETIKQEEEMNFTSRVFNYEEANFKLSKDNSICIQQDKEMNLLSVIERQQSSKRTMDSKTRIKFFIEDFRNGLQTTNQFSIQSIPSCFVKFDNSRIEPENDASVFEMKSINATSQQRQSKDQIQRSADFKYQNSRQIRSKSKQKIKLTYFNKTPQLKVKDQNIVSRCSKFQTQNSDKKLRVVSIQKKKKYGNTRNTSKWITETLQKIDIYVGDRRTQQSYQGQTRGRAREGTGKLQYINGLIYQGQFKDNTRHGHGKLTLNGKFIYQGQWQRDKLSGQGRLHNIYLVNKRKIHQSSFLRNNCYYSGTFKDNSFNGNGVLIINNSEKFQGYFKQGLPQGEFKFKNKQGEVEIGYCCLTTQNM